MNKGPSASHRWRNDADDLLGARVEDLLDAVAADTHGPGGGSVAAIAVALSASLVAMTARLSHDTWDEAGGAIAQAHTLRLRVALPIFCSAPSCWWRCGAGPDGPPSPDSWSGSPAMC
jgi:hypothetical protein